MRLSPRKNFLTSLFKEVRVSKDPKIKRLMRFKQSPRILMAGLIPTSKLLGTWMVCSALVSELSAFDIANRRFRIRPNLGLASLGLGNVAVPSKKWLFLNVGRWMKKYFNKGEGCIGGHMNHFWGALLQSHAPHDHAPRLAFPEDWNFFNSQIRFSRISHKSTATESLIRIGPLEFTTSFPKNLEAIFASKLIDIFWGYF